MLTLPIKKKWFDMIKSGEKKEEYREIKPYYDSRLRRYCIFTSRKVMENYIDEKHIIEVIFRNGYSKNSPSIKCKCNVWCEYGKEEWGAIPGKLYYVLRILNVEEIK